MMLDLSVSHPISMSVCGFLGGTLLNTILQNMNDVMYEYKMKKMLYDIF